MAKARTAREVITVVLVESGEVPSMKEKKGALNPWVIWDDESHTTM